MTDIPHSSSLYQDLEQFLSNNTQSNFHDVEFFIDNQLVFQGHRIIFSSRSSYFRALFLDKVRRGEVLELGVLRVDIQEVEERVFLEAVRWIYFGYFEKFEQDDIVGKIEESFLWRLWHLGNYFELWGLVEEVERVIYRDLMVCQNVCSFLNYLGEYFEVKVVLSLKQLCEKKIIENFTEIVFNNYHVELKKDIFTALLQNESLGLMKTVAMTRWIAYRNPGLIKRKLYILSNQKKRARTN